MGLIERRGDDDSPTGEAADEGRSRSAAGMESINNFRNSCSSIFLLFAAQHLGPTPTHTHHMLLYQSNMLDHVFLCRFHSLLSELRNGYRTGKVQSVVG